MYFKDILAHETLKSQLIREYHANHVPHAQLFTGANGVGKLPMAIAYARYLCCENPGPDDACGHCPSCAKFDILAHPDLYLTFPIIKVSSGSKREICDHYMNEFREAVLNNPFIDLKEWIDIMNQGAKQPLITTEEGQEIRSHLMLSASEGQYKVLIMWLPELMHTNCANGILKILEEPPRDTVMLLVTDNEEPILDTIMSRVQKRYFQRLPQDMIARVLMQKEHMGETMAMQIAHRAQGSMVAAHELLRTDNERADFREYFIQLMRLSYARKIKDMKIWSETLAKLTRDEQIRFFKYALTMVRENFIYNFGLSELNYMTPEENEFSSRFARFVNERNIYQLMHEMDEAIRHIEQNANAKIVLFDFALKMIVLLKQPT